jgi:hypothetical protein
VTIASTFAAVFTALENVPGLRVSEVPAPGTPPDDGLALLFPLDVDFDQTMGRGSDSLVFEMQLLVSTSDPRRQIETLAKLITDVKAEVESGVGACRVVNASSFGPYSLNDINLYGCRLRIEVTGIA